MADSSIVEKISRALAKKHYEDRFGQAKGREEIIRQNVDGNWMIFSADAEMAMRVAGEEFARLADLEQKERTTQAEVWDRAQVEGEGDRSAHQRFVLNNRLEAECAGRIATSIRLRIQSESDRG